MQIPTMPFSVLALAPFRSIKDTNSGPTTIPVDMTRLDDVMSRLGIVIFLPLPIPLCPEGGVEIRVTGMKDFHPDQIVQKTPYLKNIKEAMEAISQWRSSGISANEIQEKIKAWPNLPALAFGETLPAQKKSNQASSAIESLLDMVALPEEAERKLPEKTTGLLEQLGQTLQEILTHVFSTPEFKVLESVWRGVALFQKQGLVKNAVSLSIVPVAAHALKERLALLTAALIDAPPSLVVIDIPFDNSPASLETLEAIATFAETLMAPSLVWVTENFFYLDTWEQLKNLPFLPNHLDQPHYAKWRKLQKEASGAWLAVTANRLVSRYPYGKENKTRTVDFLETDYRWIAPVWGAAALMAQSAEKTGWPTRFTDHQSILLTDLPLQTRHPDKPVSTEIIIPSDRMEHFKRIGMTPVTGAERKDIAFTPVDTTVAGSSFARHLFLSIITKFIFWSLDTLDKNAGPREIESLFRRAIQIFFEQRGGSSPTDIMVSTGPPRPDNRIPLTLSFTPPREILRDQEKVLLEFVW